jgi:hypothetical protein
LYKDIHRKPQEHFQLVNQQVFALVSIVACLLLIVIFPLNLPAPENSRFQTEMAPSFDPMDLDDEEDDLSTIISRTTQIDSETASNTSGVLF